MAGVEPLNPKLYSLKPKHATLDLAPNRQVSLELGGNAPFIVFDDADVELAAKGVASSAFRNAGQTCICANRIFVQVTACCYQSADACPTSTREISPLSLCMAHSVRQATAGIIRLMGHHGLMRDLLWECQLPCLRLSSSTTASGCQTYHVLFTPLPAAGCSAGRHLQ